MRTYRKGDYAVNWSDSDPDTALCPGCKCVLEDAETTFMFDDEGRRGWICGGCVERDRQGVAA